jgi:phage shock protein PspC (stress-responsive transcriptional regulator)
MQPFFRGILEKSAFGVCIKIGEKLGISTTAVRKFFIYISLLTFGSPVIIYFLLAFWINIKKAFRDRHSYWLD